MFQRGFDQILLAPQKILKTKCYFSKLFIMKDGYSRQL